MFGDYEKVDHFDDIFFTARKFFNSFKAMTPLSYAAVKDPVRIK
jgi:hypothetical protein